MAVAATVKHEDPHEVTALDVQRAEHRRDHLSVQLAAARSRLLQLLQVTQQPTPERLRALGVEVLPDRSEQLHVLATAIREAETAIAPLMASHGAQLSEAARLRREREAVLNALAHTQAAALYGEIAEHLDALDALGRQLQQLHQLRPGTIRPAFDLEILGRRRRHVQTLIATTQGESR